jgi:hypothetical protein
MSLGSVLDEDEIWLGVKRARNLNPFTPNFGKRGLGDSKPLKSCIIEKATRQGLVSIGFEDGSESANLVDDDGVHGLHLASVKKDISGSTERKGLESKLSLKIEGFLCFQEL